MAIAIALWSIVLQPGKKTKLVPQSDIRITNATLGDKLADESSRTSVKLTYEIPTRDDNDDALAAGKAPPKTTTVLCSLTPGKIEQSVLDLIVEEDGEYEIESVGKNTVHLSGNYIDQSVGTGYGDSDMDDDEDMSDMDDMDPALLGLPSDEDEGDDEVSDADRFEEVDEAAVKSLKRASDAMDVEPTEGETKPSKKDKKKQKKLKAEDGKAVPTGDAEVTPSKKPVSKAEGTPAKTPESKAEKKEKKEKKSEPTGKLKTLESGLKIMDNKVGTGKAAKAGDQVSMRYIGKLENNTIFDSNTKGTPFRFHLGAGQVIKGWDEGIVGMQPGGERLLIVPAKLGYGGKKMEGIPPNSTLKFECKLIQIK